MNTKHIVNMRAYSIKKTLFIFIVFYFYTMRVVKIKRIIVVM